uniref:Uncharacterized protein n=1 Tax=Ditylenchus dipsaci TaxID=166011 RepID=A0A915CSQ4_9BILA
MKIQIFPKEIDILGNINRQQKIEEKGVVMNGRIQFDPSQLAIGRVAATALLGFFPDSDQTLVMEIQGVPAFQAMAMNPRPIPPLIPTVHDLKQLLADEFPQKLGSGLNNMRFRVSNLQGGYVLLEDDEALSTLSGQQRIILGSIY